MAYEWLPNVDVRYLDAALMPAGVVWPVSSALLREVDPVHLRAWCVKRGVCQIPTIELIAWLKQTINGRSAIEICAGRSCLGRHIGSPMFDNYLHAQRQIRAHYKRMGQTHAIPDRDVQRMDANEAVRRFKPEVVVGAWVTQKRFNGEEQASDFGVDEHKILDAGCTYIHIGNLGPHGQKRILIRPHHELELPFLFGRGIDASLNRVWVWESEPAGQELVPFLSIGTAFQTTKTAQVETEQRRCATADVLCLLRRR